MTRNLILTGIVLIMTSCNSINPFFGDWDTPYSLPPFGEIHETDYLRAVKFGIHQSNSTVILSILEILNDWLHFLKHRRASSHDDC